MTAHLKRDKIASIFRSIEKYLLNYGHKCFQPISRAANAMWLITPEPMKIAAITTVIGNQSQVLHL